MKSSLLLNWEHFSSRYEEIEKNVTPRFGSYQGIRAEALYTSLEDLNLIFSDDLVTGSFMDLGCGNGRTALLYGYLYPERQSFGIEFESERLKNGEEFRVKNHLNNVSLIHDDLSSCLIPKTDTYFLYFPTGPVLDRILASLYENHHFFRLIVIESHGDLFPRIDLENWLTLKKEIPLHSLRHHPCARIYERLNLAREERLLPFALTYKNKFLLIEDEHECWIGETLGMEWTEGDRFELLIPPRTINWKTVKKMMVLTDFEASVQMVLKLRPMGEVLITTSQGKHRGFIRKIMIKPSFRLELSTGEQVEWSEILTITQGLILCYESYSEF